ncbi:MAG: type II toxin-antitoxin system prevent-host-death family antitoxin [Cyanobacteria bacterium K_DeepCast_35m_m2_155]|nr:type II toxin-antitoxin system prevent-host-death family antitoxin [Cyanobacteria bacterium K_DeepCast_35m_m2_155]
MKTVGAFEAKTHLSKLLEEVQQGEEVLITRHGRAVARMLPMQANHTEQRLRAIEQLRNFRSGKRLQGLTIQQLRDEGRQR